MRPIFVPGIALTLVAGFAVASSSWQKDDPSQWTSTDVYQILNNSAWSKSASVSIAMAPGYGNSGSNGGNGGTWGSDGPMPGGGMGRIGGMGGGGMGGGGMGRRGGGYPRNEQSTTVTVRWESALPVRLAEAKESGGPADPNAMKPLNEYVIVVIGLPKSGLGAQGPTAGSGDDSDDLRLADRLKAVTVLSFGHEQLNPTKVELNQGRDARTIFHFDKSEPVTLQNKNAEFRITAERMELRKKFALKDMEYQGKLEL